MSKGGKCIMSTCSNIATRLLPDRRGYKCWVCEKCFKETIQFRKRVRLIKWNLIRINKEVVYAI